MLFIADVGFFVSERRFYLSIEYGLVHPPISAEVTESVVNTVDEFVTRLPWSAILHSLDPERKSKYAVRCTKNIARKFYTILIENTA